MQINFNSHLSLIISKKETFIINKLIKTLKLIKVICVQYQKSSIKKNKRKSVKFYFKNKIKKLPFFFHSDHKIFKTYLRKKEATR